MINLSESNYEVRLAMATLLKPNINELRLIEPSLNDKEIAGDNVEVIGYYDEGKMVNFSVFRQLDYNNIEKIQITKSTPDSLQSECAYFKARGFKYLHLEPKDE